MSSREYSTVLDPDPRLRAAVLLSGALAAVVGVAVVAGLPVAPFLQAGLAAAWVAWTSWQLVGLVCRYGRCRRMLVLPDGTTQILRQDGRTEPARIRTDSLVLGRIAWLRIEKPDGRRWAEPIAGNCRESTAWRRFQVIWRHLGTRV